MEKRKLKNYYICLISGFLYFLIYFFVTEVLEMSDLIGAVIGAAAVIAVPIIANTIQLKAINKHLGFGNDEESMKRQLDRKLGVKETSPSITDQLGVKGTSLSITDQIGVKETSLSITDQLGVEKEDISIAYQNRKILKELALYKAEQKKRAKRFSKKQKDVKQKVEEIADFLKDWERLNSENQDLREKVVSLEKAISIYERAVSEAAGQNQMLHSENENLHSKNEELKRMVEAYDEHSNAQSKQDDEEDWGAEM